MPGLITVDIDVSGMDRVLKAISGAAKIPMREATIAESGAILQTCLDRTKLHAKGRIQERTKKKFNNYAAGEVGGRASHQYPRISISPNKSHAWWITGASGEGHYRVFHEMKRGDRHWPDLMWNQYQAEERDRKADLKEAVTEQLARRGLPKQSWYWLADLIGLQLKAAQEVIDAKVRKRVMRNQARALSEELRDSYTIHFTNSSIASIRKGAAKIISTVIRGRVKYFKRNLENGVFDSLEKIQKAYPNLLKINRT